MRTKPAAVQIWEWCKHFFKERFEMIGAAGGTTSRILLWV